MKKRMKKRMKKLIRDFLRQILGSKGYAFLRFILTHHYLPNICKPRTFSEKIQHRKFFTDPHLWARFVDKYLVREYVSEVIGSQYLIPLISKSEILKVSDFDELPDKFVIKTSNGGGGVNVKVVKDKSNLNFNEVVRDFNASSKENIGSKIDEYFYDVNPGCILIENMIENSDGSILLDYKFHLFRDELSCFVLLQVNSEYGTSNETKTLYELDGNKSEIQFLGYKLGPDKIELPSNFQQMVDLSKKLSKDLGYVRVDLYNVDGNIYFGEITVCPASGWDKVNSKSNDYFLGGKWGVN